MSRVDEHLSILVVGMLGSEIREKCCGRDGGGGGGTNLRAVIVRTVI